MPNVKTPVVMIIFNRPDLTERLFAEVARARPSKLLVIADGPRPDRPGEREKVAATRKIIDQVDWECEVLRHYSETNLGCKRRVSSGINWAFEQVEEAIILEDDCIPDPSFFPFCEELLNRYRNEPEVMMITGTCFLGNHAPKGQSYYFSHLPLIWGWASWRRAWKQYDISMKQWPTFRESPKFEKIFPSSTARNHYRQQVDKTFSGALDTWDLQWSYSVWNSGGVCINSTHNLVRNIGFGPGATHTHFYDEAFNPPVRPVDFPLVHPTKQSTSPELDRIWLDHHYSFQSKVMRRVRTYGNKVASLFK